MNSIRPISRVVMAMAALALLGSGLAACDSEEEVCCWPTAAIGTRYAELAGPTGPLGDCRSGEYDSDGGRVQDFDNGAIYWTDKTGGWEVYGLIGAEYDRMGGPESAVRWPVSGELATPGGAGRFNRFQNGNIYHSPAGTHAVYGAIFDEWARQGYENGRLGFPTSDEQDVPTGRRMDFERGWIEWNSATGQVTTG
ncbi:LGFP repeat-containing protein [Nocardia shimofusensis]|uniref:LGFP repeat-containing protein n=1 Tax=Nocardia shimofusensis TaxID=228596 RepID=UPI001FDFD73C|nr:trehalose corynomycolyl transferase [Nocardia shimofusensis]